MYLSGLQLCNFRNFRSACFVFEEGANTIIGENDSGKSNAIAGLRILLDDSLYYNTKRLKESDFSHNLGDWRGHWIAISATFSDITNVDKRSEIVAAMAIDGSENAASLSALISNDRRDHGVVTLFVRPQKRIRQQLFEATGKREAFNAIRRKIRLADYEFYFTARSKADFCDAELYKGIVGDLELCVAPNPEDDDASVLGHRVAITDIKNHISLVYIDALRDVLREMRMHRNPIRRIIEAIENDIEPCNIEDVRERILKLNQSITNISEVSGIGRSLNQKLLDILGMVYSPEIGLASELSDEMNKLSRFISMKPRDEDDLELLGLGHLNMIYLALKILEFEVCRSRELLNIMVIEEPEAHIHSHIQRTLFKNLSAAKGYTQVIMTTHSAHLAEASEISRMNILKTLDRESIAMKPTNGLDEYGVELNNRLLLTRCIERYLDAKRSVLLFSKGVILVEGDAEEILLPGLVRHAFGVSLDEIGIGLVNVGSTAFEYVASVFGDRRVQRFCAIVTDLDRQAVDSTSRFYSEAAQIQGDRRKQKLDRLYESNPWVHTFCAEHTFEIEFLNGDNNCSYFSSVVDQLYKQESTIRRKKENLTNNDTRSEALFEILEFGGKGWVATLLAGELDSSVGIPDYLVGALAYASQETMDLRIYKKMLTYSLSHYEDTGVQEYVQRLEQAENDTYISEIINDIVLCHSADIAVQFVIECEKNTPHLLPGDTSAGRY